MKKVLYVLLMSTALIAGGFALTGCGGSSGGGTTTDAGGGGGGGGGDTQL